MMNDSDADEYRKMYEKEHGDMNPYTVVDRHPSQTWVLDEKIIPLDAYLAEVQNAQSSTTSNQSSMASASFESFESRYVIPNVVHPTYNTNQIENDLRTGGNPYQYHINYARPSQYLSYIVDEKPIEKSTSESELLTRIDVANMEDPFNNNILSNYPPLVNPPSDVTLNKRALSSDSIESLKKLNVDFPIKEYSRREFGPVSYSETPTLNKKMLSSDSIYELNKLNVVFEEKLDANPVDTSLKIQEFSLETLKELRGVRSLSEYTDFNFGSSKDVNTCLGISPTPHEQAFFEYTENVQYGGI